MSKVKAIDNIIKSVLKTDNVQLAIVGDGEERSNLELLAGNSKKVKFIGSVMPSEVSKYMKESDILIMNSILEGKPMTIIEAMSYGLPIVTTKVGGIEELVTTGKEGEFTDGTEKSVEKAIKKVKEKYNYYSNNALNKSKEFDYRVVNEIIYEKIFDVFK